MKKKIVLSILCINVSLSLFAQTDNAGHLRFDGIPIDGTLQSFVDKMREKGYRQIRKREFAGRDCAMMKGRFASVKVRFSILSVPSKDYLVYSVLAIFHGKKSSELISKYYRLKDELSKECGYPLRCVENSGPSPLFNDSEWIGQHSAYFRVPEGVILLKIIQEADCVAITYFDSINFEIYKAERGNVE